MIVAELFATLGLIPKESEWAKGDKLIEHLHHALEVFVGVEAIKGVYEMVHGVVELGSALNDTAQKSGLSVEGLQFYGFVAKQNSATMEELAGAVTKYSRGLDEAKTKGSGPAAEALQRLGISVSDTKFKTMSLDGQVQLISDKLAKLPDGTTKTALAMDLFGRSGASLIPTLNDLGKNGDELRKKFEELGGGLSGKQAADLDEFGDEMDRAKFSLGTLKNQVVAQMIPALRDMLHEFMAWLKANRELIATSITGVLRGLITAVEWAGKALGVLVSIIQWLADHKEVTAAILGALGGVIAAFAIEAAINWLIAFWPLVLVIGVIAAVILAVQKLWHWIKDGDDVAARTIRKMIGWLRDLVSFVVDTAKTIKKGFEDAFNWLINTPIVKGLIALVDKLKEFGARPKGSDEAHRGMAGTTGGQVNDWFNDHPWIAKISSALGGAGNPEKIREDVQERVYGSGRAPRDRDDDKPSQQTNHFGDTHVTINGAKADADELAEKFRGIAEDVHKERAMQALDAFRGGRR